MIRFYIDLQASCGGKPVPVPVAQQALNDFMAKDEHFLILASDNPAKSRIIGVVQKAGIDNMYRPYIDTQIFDTEDGRSIIELMRIQCPFYCGLYGQYQLANEGLVGQIAINAIVLEPKAPIQA